MVDNYTSDKIEIYQKEYDSGKSLKTVAKEYGIWSGTLSKYLKLRKSSKLHEEQRKQRGINGRKIYRNKVKDKAVQYKGGKCCVCGYNKCNQALEFHHLNPEEKEFTISGGTRSFEFMKEELNKCILVCRNCHSEIHAGFHEEYWNVA